ncbi:hypothetical protein MRY87_12305 [bacterium]|nr:hypothetical protein [bacterium]
MRGLTLLQQQEELLEAVYRCSQELSSECYLVGGFVRDLFLFEKLPEGDIDIVTLGSSEGLSALLHQRVGGQREVFRPFLTSKLSSMKRYPLVDEIDLATARREQYEEAGVLPKVEAVGDLLPDLARRDFSINALALPLGAFLKFLGAETGDLSVLRQAVMDPHHGLQHLSRQELHVLHDESFFDDPTRLFRLCRYETRLDFRRSPQTERLVQRAREAKVLRHLSLERIHNELKKCFLEGDPLLLLERLFSIGFGDSDEVVEGVLQLPSLEQWRLLGEFLRPLPSSARNGFFQFFLWFCEEGGRGSRTAPARELCISQLQRLGVGKKASHRYRRFLAIHSLDGASPFPEVGAAYSEFVRE